MTLREKIADIISGGALSREISNKNRWQTRYISAMSALESERLTHESDLRAIIALETPSMAHVGKRAVKIAREAMGE